MTGSTHETDETVGGPEPLVAVAMGQGLRRREGPLKVTGLAPYAWEVEVPDPWYLHLVQSTVAKGRVEHGARRRRPGAPGGRRGRRPHERPAAVRG